MVAFLPIVALLGLGSADQALDRMQKYYAGAKTLDTEIAVSYGRTRAKGRLRWSRPNLQAFEISVNGERYEYRQSTGAILELEHSGKRYAVFAPRQSLVAPPGEVSSSGPAGYPDLLLDRAPVLQAIRGNAERSHSTGTIDGKRVDNVSARFTNPMSSSTYVLSIDANGCLRRLRRTVEDRVSRSEMVVDYGNTKRNLALPSSIFSTVIPSGYSPERLPEMRYPSQAGTRIPKVECLDVGTGRTTVPEKLFGKGGALILLSEQSSALSDRMAGLLAGVGPKAKKMGVALIEIDLSTTKPRPNSPRTGFGARLWDASGRFRTEFGVPGTPMALLYGGDAKLRQAWMGFSASERATMEREMQESLADLDGAR